jgi:hypothetical protein
MSALPQWIVKGPPLSVTDVGIVIVNWRLSSANLSRKSLRETTITGCFQIKNAYPSRVIIKTRLLSQSQMLS